MLKADEGGFGPPLDAHAAALELLASRRSSGAGLRPGADVAYALDVAATHFHDPDDGTYQLAAESGARCTPRSWSELVAELGRQYPIVSRRGRASPRTTGTAGRADRRLGGRVQ